jgi:class 3 adenylate cyclase/YHS domain-containing protein
MDAMSLHELADASGESPERLRHWYSLGLLPGPSAGELTPECIERVRLIQFAVGRGITDDTLAAAHAEQGDLLGQYLSLLTPAGPRATYVFDDVAAQTGIDAAVVTRIAAAIGLDEQAALYKEDVAALHSIRTALDAGFPEEALVQLARVCTDALNRVAEAETRLFRFYVHKHLRDEGLVGDELIAAQQAVNDQLLRLIEPTILYFHRKGWERALREDFMLHLAEDLAAGQEPGRLRLAIAFVDLASFTPLSQAMGDVAAAEVLERFSKVVRTAASHHAGTVVKQIGDAFMVVFPGSAPAVEWALDVEERASTEGRFPAVRAGIHVGEVLYRDGDYVGTNVNIAARIADAADRHEVLVTTEVAEEGTDLAGVEFGRLGSRRLKGLVDDFELFRVQCHTTAPTRAIDPVCGMELDADDAAAQLQWERKELLFCSIECLQRFTVAPEHYTVSAR